jgi:hypothetical protein
VIKHTKEKIITQKTFSFSKIFVAILQIKIERNSLINKNYLEYNEKNNGLLCEV